MQIQCRKISADFQNVNYCQLKMTVNHYQPYVIQLISDDNGDQLARNRKRNQIFYELKDDLFRIWIEERQDREGVFRVRYRVKGQKIKSISFRNLEEAEMSANNLWEQYLIKPTRTSVKSYKTISELSEWFYSRESLRPKTKRAYRQSLNEFCSVVGPSRSFKRIISADIEVYLNSLSCSPASKQSKLRAVKTLFNFAVRNELIKSNPAKNFSIKVKQEIRPYLLPKEIPLFLNSCKPSFYPRALFTIETGCRSAELINLRWCSLFLDREKPFVVFEDNKETNHKTKSGKRGAVPLSKTALACLEVARHQWKKTDYVFSDGYLNSATNLCRDTHMAARKAGTTDIDFHGLRRTAAIRWLMNGVPIHIVSQLLRHSSIDITVKHYGWLMTDELARHIEGF